MPALRDIVDGITILAKYRKKGLDSFGIQAEHDEIYVGIDEGQKVSEEDDKKLDELGWGYDESSGCFVRNV